MLKLLIADDEPLVQAGIKSMINWDELDITVVGTASNGSVAYNMILEHSPDIVLTDIKMPVMTGLELVQKCYNENRELPVFIILTSYEEFSFVRQALTYQVIDYLVKLEMTPEVLENTLKRAIARVNELQKNLDTNTSLNSISILKAQFFTRLTLNLFESEQQFLTQAQYLNLDFGYDTFAVSYTEIFSSKFNQMDNDKQINLCTNSLQMASELISKHIPCHVFSMDMKHFCCIFLLKDGTEDIYKQQIKTALEQVASMLFNYYSVTILSGVGSFVQNPLQISASYQDGKQIFSQVTHETPLLFLPDSSCEISSKNVFNMSLFKEDIRKAYAEFDEKTLYTVFTSIIELFENHPTHYVQALDAASSILHLSLSLLNNGEQVVSEIFANYPNGYRSLFELSGVEQILDWLKHLRDGLYDIFKTYNKDYKNHIVINVKKYITEHIEEKLTLNGVAEVFSISPNYLSVLFSKYNDVGFSDFINHTKIETAKQMMANNEYKIYEISDILGFESAFYFSRVFKKVTGLSPRDYIKNNL